MEKSPLAFFLVFLLHMLLHINLTTAQNPCDFSFPLDPNFLQGTGNRTVSSESITLKASEHSAVVLTKDPEALRDPSTSTAISFNTSFLFSANPSNSDGGTLAFIIVADSDTFERGAIYRENTFAVEFKITERPGHPEQGPTAGMQVNGFINGSRYNTSPWFPLSDCDDSAQCNYQALVQYDGISVVVSPCNFPQPLSFQADLSNVFTESMYVGFLADNGFDASILQWNFTVGMCVSTVSSISNHKSTLSTGFVVGFSVLGAAFGVALIFGCCLFWRKPSKKRITRVHGATRDGQNFETTPHVITIKPATAPKNPVTERDNAPLNPMTQTDSTFGVSGTASWLKPVTGR